MTFSECFAYGALISSTDPVAILSSFKEYHIDKTLFILIFGESILNDAVSIILYNTAAGSKEGNRGFSQITFEFLKVFLGSILIGMLIGMITSYILKNQDPNKEITENKEQTLLTVIPWVSYLIGEGLQYSGIVSIMFCGIAMARYSLRNVSENSKKITKRFY